MSNKKISQRELLAALDDLKMLKYFPADAGAQASVLHLLARMCPHREALDWLVSACVDNLSEWPGPSNLRGLLCTHFKPADGIERDCGIPGWRPADLEAKAANTEFVPLAAGDIKQIAAPKEES